GGRRSPQHPGDRGDGLRHEGRRGAHPAGRLRGVHLQADLGASLHRDDKILSGRRLMTARILVVDDVPANVKLLEVRLLAEYFEVLTAANGADALEICENGKVDVVLLDVMMPDMDGFEVCRRLKQDPATSHI